MEFVSGGYFLVRGTRRADSMSPALPSTLWSRSTCVCDTLPHSWAFPWARPSPDELSSVRELLDLTSGGFEALREAVEGLRASGHLGWPNTFLDLGAAREFRQRHCSAVPETRLLGISLPSSWTERFLDDARPAEGRARQASSQPSPPAARRPPAHRSAASRCWATRPASSTRSFATGSKATMPASGYDSIGPASSGISRTPRERPRSRIWSPREPSPSPGPPGGSRSTTGPRPRPDVRPSPPLRRILFGASP